MYFSGFWLNYTCKSTICLFADCTKKYIVFCAVLENNCENGTKSGAEVPDGGKRKSDQKFRVVCERICANREKNHKRYYAPEDPVLK